MPWTPTSRAFVWAWLPDEISPVPAGVLQDANDDGQLWFAYGKSYLSRQGAVALAPDLPLGEELVAPGVLGLPGSIRDAGPDGWGQRVVLRELANVGGRAADPALLPELAYLLESGSDRFGALDFQRSSQLYEPRTSGATLDELQQAANLLDHDLPLPAALEMALLHGTSIGGARPKATIVDPDGSWIAKFASSSDVFDAVGTEAAAMFLARKAGVDASDVRVTRSLGKKVLLVRRFDRPGGGVRVAAISGLTLLGLSEIGSRYGSYPQLAARLQVHGDGGAGPELFRRAAFNIAVSNTDDHLRNHAALWDGRHLRLSPAYDIAPGIRRGESASQAIAIGMTRQPLGARTSNFATLIHHAAEYGLSRTSGAAVVDRIVAAITDNWDDAVAFAELSNAQARQSRELQFLNRAAFYPRE